MSAIRLTVLSLAALVAASGVASAQSSYLDGAPPIYGRSTAYGQALSPSDAQALLAVLRAAKAGDTGSIQAAMAGLYDPLPRKIAQWALADAQATSYGYQGQMPGMLPLGWPRTDRRQVEAQRQQLIASLDDAFQSGWTALTRLQQSQDRR